MKHHRAATIFPMMGSEELEKLADDIKKNGLIHPIVVHDGEILDGRNRAAACHLAHVTPRYEPWEGKGSPAAYVLGVNGPRRHLNPSQLAMAAAKAKEELEVEARERQAKAAKSTNEKLGRGQAKTLTPNSEEASPKGEAAALAGKKLGVPASQVYLADKVIQEAPAEIVEAVEHGDVTVSDAAGIVHLPKAEQLRALERVVDGSSKTLTKAVATGNKQAQATYLRNKPPPLPAGPFGVIAADPPWLYTLREEDESHRGKTDYAQMTLDQVAMLPVEKLAAKDCALWLWCTNAFLANGDAAKVVSAWGFEAKTILTWDKQRIGIGNYLRNSTEHCIIATRGSPVFQPGGVPTLISAPRREHSRKPDEFYALVEAVCPDNARVELFSRTPRPGWVIWGDQAGKFAPAGGAP